MFWASQVWIWLLTEIGKRHWAFFEVISKSQAMSELERKLERAKSLLGLAVKLYSM